MNSQGLKEMQKYTVNSYGLVADPGKFEGEPPWVVAAYYDHLGGLWEEGEDYAYTQITKEDVEQFPDVPEFREGSWMVLGFSSQGFVSGEVVDYYPGVED